jgi:hypothetical protein
MTETRDLFELAPPPGPDHIDPYDRAVQAEPQLRPIVRLVEALVDLRRPSDRLCAGCVWETIVKPLVSPLVGWGRGYPPEQAKDRDSWQPRRLRVTRASEIRPRSRHVDLTPYLVDARQLLDEDDDQLPATSETERWLRTSEAYDAVTGRLLAKLDQADPGNGHGIGRKHRDTS